MDPNSNIIDFNESWVGNTLIPDMQELSVHYDVSTLKKAKAAAQKELRHGRVSDALIRWLDGVNDREYLAFIKQWVHGENR